MSVRLDCPYQIACVRKQTQSSTLTRKPTKICRILPRRYLMRPWTAPKILRRDLDGFLQRFDRHRIAREKALRQALHRPGPSQVDMTQLRRLLDQLQSLLGPCLQYVELLAANPNQVRPEHAQLQQELKGYEGSFQKVADINMIEAKYLRYTIYYQYHSKKP